jgi:tetratricopeptide (TPR) repeat protein
MKAAVRILILPLLTFALLAPPSAVFAWSRDKDLKRAQSEIRKGNFNEAEKIYRHLIEKKPEDNDARLGLSFTLIKKLRLQEAYEEAAQVMVSDPLSGRAHSLLGTALLRSGEFRNSVEALLTALKFNNRDALALAGLAEVASFENRSRLAYEGLHRAIQIDPLEPDYYVSLARACSRLELYTEAADAYQRFLEVAPKTDAERRARIRGLIDFYRYLGTSKLHRLGGKDVSSTPFDLIGNRPFINVTVNGKETLRFVIDTGASLSVISDKAAQKLGIRPVARGGNARAVGGTGTFPIIYGLLDSLTIGDAKIDLVPIYIRTVHSTSDTPKDERADGYLGLSVLSNYGVTIDYQNRTLVLDRTPLREESATAATTVMETAASGTNEVVISVRSTSGGLASAETHLPTLTRPLNFIVDTGATSSVVSKAAVKRYRLEGMKMPHERTRVIGAAGVEEGVETLSLATLTVSNLRQQNARALILDLEPVNETSGFEQHGIIGGDFLRHFRLHLDLRRYQLRLTPQSPAIKIATY